MTAIAAPARSTAAAGVAALGHGMIFAGFFQPWVAGQFGARERLSGIDLARLANGLIDHGLAGDVLMLPVTRLLLFAVPITAANALLLLVLGQLRLIRPRHARRLAALLALPALLVAIVALALLAFTASNAGSVIDGPALGLLVVTAGAVIATAAPLVRHRRRSPATAEAIRPRDALREA